MINQNKKPFENFTKYISVFFKTGVVLLVLFFILGQLSYPNEKKFEKNDCSEFNYGWLYIDENGEKTPVTVPTTIKNAPRGKEIVFENVIPSNISEKDHICFRPVWQDVTIYIDGVLRYSYSTKHSRPFGNSSTYRYIFVELSRDDIGKTISYRTTADSKYAGHIHTVLIGDKFDIWSKLIKRSALKSVTAFFLFFLSFFCICICWVLKHIYKKKLSLGNMAWAVFFASIWVISEVEFRQILFNNVSILSGFTYWSLMILPFPMISYMNDIQEERYKKLYIFPAIYSAFLIIITTILQILNIVQFVNVLPFIHFGTFLCIIIIVSTIIIDLFKNNIKEYLSVGLGVFGILASVIFEIFFYYFTPVYSLGTVLMIGLVFLLGMAVLKTGQDMFYTEKKKQEAIIAKESQAKFLANMSHEIRTPINVVIGMNEMILRENKNHEIEQYSRNIQNASNMLLGLVNDVLDFSKIESGQYELVENSYTLKELINDELLILNTRAAGKSISTYLEVDPNLPSVLWGDELRIKQCLTNLISNAVKYTNVGNVSLKAFFEVLDSDHIMLCFTVTDTGSGIKEENISKLFDTFKRLELDKNRNIEGTGLGLNIVQRLLSLMNGSISVNSEYGKGSSFTIRIPQKIVDSTIIGPSFETNEKRAEEVKKLNSKQSFFTAPNASVLVVDDNKMNLTLMKGLLKRTKINVDLANSGSECLKLTENKFYHLIFMDHMMPEMDGIETLKLLRSSENNPNKDTIIIVLTANAIAGFKEMYMAEGFNDYFTKPIEAQKLDKLLMQYLPDDLVILEEE